jgi:non-specific serine/threonine protein kinase
MPVEQVVVEASEEIADAGAAAAPPDPRETPRAPLTRREQEVAELIAAGAHRDRDIAAALTIAETTAGLHVRRILAKLGLHSRWEIAARLGGTGRGRDLAAPAPAADRRRG